MNTRLLVMAVLTAGTLLAGTPAVTSADEYGHHARQFHGGHVDADERRHGDLHRWRGGHWYRGGHAGRLGWWWVVPGLGWYLYTAPVYAYAYPSYPYTPQAAVPPAAGTPLPPPAQFWYYCAAAAGYYPYVSSCPGGWQKVPATPPGVQAQ